MTYHISHNDLDGYGCQLLVNEVMNDVEFFNVNYGKELQEILDRVPFILNEGDMLLITDLNLSEDQCARLDLAATNTNFKIHLWDHHISGEKQADKYDWYHLDTSICATAITYQKLQGMFIMSSEKLNKLTDLINTYDMWKEDNSQINMSKSLNQVFNENKNSFPTELKNEERLFLFYVIKEMSDNLFKADINEAENCIYGMIFKYFHTYCSFNFCDSNMPLHILKIQFFYEKLMEKTLQIFEFNGLRGEIYFGLSSIFQEFSSIRLNEVNALDFVVNISNNGYISFRTKKDGINLSELSKKYFFGGGHAKASGGSLLGAPKTFTKQEAILQFFSQFKSTHAASKYNELNQEEA